jgi:adenine-specific DNA-methyltransferase
LNKQDGGNRKFILIEMEDYANTITAERVKRVIKGYGTEAKPIEGTCGDFSFYELGEPIFLENDLLNESIGVERIKEYVWFSETKSKYTQQLENHLLGVKEQTAYYFYYNKSNMTTLDESFLRKLKTKAEQYIIYADNCLLDEKLMNKYHIIFKKIPRDITRF